MTAFWSSPKWYDSFVKLSMKHEHYLNSCALYSLEMFLKPQTSVLICKLHFGDHQKVMTGSVFKGKSVNVCALQILCFSL